MRPHLTDDELAAWAEYQSQHAARYYALPVIPVEDDRPSGLLALLVGMIAGLFTGWLVTVTWLTAFGGH